MRIRPIRPIDLNEKNFHVLFRFSTDFSRYFVLNKCFTGNGAGALTYCRQCSSSSSTMFHIYKKNIPEVDSLSFVVSKKNRKKKFFSSDDHHVIEVMRQLIENLPLLFDVLIDFPLNIVQTPRFVLEIFFFDHALLLFVFDFRRFRIN